MITILIFIIILLIFRIYLSGYPEHSKARSKAERYICVVAFGVLVFLAAFRSENVGADTGGYINDYNNIVLLKYSDIIGKYASYWVFYSLMKIFNMMNLPLWAFFGIVEFVYISSIARLINRYSKDKLYSIILFVVLLYSFSLAGMKQVFAMGLMLYSFIEFMDKRYIRAIALAVLAYFSHPVAMIFLFAYLLYVIKEKSYFFLVIFGIVLLFVIGSMTTMASFVSYLGDDHFETYLEKSEGYSSVVLIFYLLLLISALPFYKSYSKTTMSKGLARFELGCICVACSLQYLAFFSPNLFRLAYLYTPFYLILLPNAFSSQSGNASQIAKYIVLFGAIFFYAYSSRDFIYTMSW